MDTILGLAAGPILALIPVLAWELSIRPWQTRRRLAKSLRVELRASFSTLGANALVSHRTGFIPPNRLSLAVLTATLGDIGLLPIDAAGFVLQIYHLFEKLNLFADEFRELWTSNRPDRDQRLLVVRTTYNDSAQHAMQLYILVLPVLDAIADAAYLDDATIDAAVQRARDGVKRLPKPPGIELFSDIKLSE